MDQKSISQGTLWTDLGVNNGPILALKVSKEALAVENQLTSVLVCAKGGFSRS